MLHSDALCICLLTYARTEYAVRTLRTTLDNLRSRHQVHVHIADDGSIPEHRDLLTNSASRHLHVASVTISNSERGGYGRNVNLATQVIHGVAAWYLMLEDDWELTRPLDVDAIIEDMQCDGGLECIRLGYLSHTQALYGEVKTVGPRNSKYLLLSANSPEPHVFAGHPRIESLRYQRAVGPWPQGHTPGETEFIVTHFEAARHGVAWPMCYDPNNGPYVHIGTNRAW